MLLDGATGSELTRRGADTALPLWSARALLTAPERVAEIHRDYLAAGAEAITTNTFRTHARSLAKAGLGARAAELTASAVALAIAAAGAAARRARVFGSVAPLEDCYRPELAPSSADCAREHAALIEQLLAAGVDLVLIETQNCVREARAAIAAARVRAPGRFAASFCLKADAAPGTLLSGEPLAALAQDLEDAVAAGVNCVPFRAVLPHVEYLRALLPPHVQILARGNAGRADDACGWARDEAGEAALDAAYAAEARRWRDAGAEWIGGCCGTTPGTIRAVGAALAAARG